LVIPEYSEAGFDRLTHNWTVTISRERDANAATLAAIHAPASPDYGTQVLGEQQD
jgi:hypothetical protein